MADQEHIRVRTSYEANCHCGLIRYTVTLDDALAPAGKGTINQCNCSICTKNGYLLVYPRREDVVFRDSCDEKLADYFFGLKRKPHRFCPQCGSSVLIDFKDSNYENQRTFLAMNARLFKGIDLEQAKYTTFDGRSRLEPAYKGPARGESMNELKEADTKTMYYGNCHCGSVRFTVALADKLAPEGKGKLTQCNCSVCTKNGYLLAFPQQDDVVFVGDAKSKLKSYWFGMKQKPHRFCGNCGSSMGVIDDAEKLPMQAINARMFPDIDLEKAEFITFDGKSKLEPAYEM